MIEARNIGTRWLAWTCLAVLGALLWIANPGFAQGIGRPNNIAVDVIAERLPAPGETALVALHFRPKSREWHGYWSNPGDAGKGMTLDWRLPPGWSAGEPLYPVPQRLTIAGLMNYVYEGDYTVLVPVTAGPRSAGPGDAEWSVSLDYLACTDEICVPESAEREVRLANAGAYPFARWRSSIAPLLDRTAVFQREGGLLRIGVPLPAAVGLADPYVFLQLTPQSSLRPEYAAEQVFRRDGDMLVAEIPVDGELAAGETIGGILAFDQTNGVRFEARPGDVGLADVAPLRGPATPPLLLLLGAALLGGLILNVMPCVFPILSLKALSLAKAGVSETAAKRDGLAYTAGAIVAALALGAVMLALRAAGEQVGWAFQLQEPAVVVALLILASVLTANFAGLFELPNLPIRAGGDTGGAFVTGLLAAFVATPCTGPFMAAALGASLILPPVQALALFAALGLGLALPFLLLGYVPALRERLPRPGPWMKTFRGWMTVPMGLTALALVWLIARLGGKPFALLALLVVAGVVGALAIVGKLQRKGALAWPSFALVVAPFAIFGAFALPAAYAAPDRSAQASLLSPEPFSDGALAEARASGSPVFVWFTADWCVTCKVNERTSIERETTRAAFERAGVKTLRGDWTARDAEITRFLEARGAAGVPLYLWYAPGGEPEQLPQVLTPGLLSERAATSAGSDPATERGVRALPLRTP